MDDVRLPDLETIRHFSIAVRQEYAPLGEVLEALRSDLARLESEARSGARRGAAKRPSKARTTKARRKR